MVRDITINLNNFFLSVSDAIDLSSPAISTHQIRVAYLSWRLAKLAGLEAQKIRHIYIAALFHDIGALNPRDKLRLHRSEERELTPHCVRGERLFKSIPYLVPMAPLVRYHHRPWKTWQEAGKNLDDPYVLESQILNLADFVERSIDRNRYILDQSSHITGKVLALSGKEIHRDVVDLFMSLAKQEACWLDIVSPRLYSILLNYGPLEHIQISLDEVAQLATFFSKIIDFRSKYTSTHSSGVVACATILSHICGLTEQEILLMKIAASLHDLGKLVVPNSILEKPGKLTREEFNIVKQHTYHTYMILSSIHGFETIAEWAAFHHEKLDGSGYPFGLTAERLTLGARIMAVADIFTALIERRPYRDGMPDEKVKEIFTNQVKKGQLDGKIVKALFDHFDEIKQRVTIHQEIAQNTFLDYLTKPNSFKIAA